MSGGHDHDAGAGLRSVDEARDGLLAQIDVLPSLELPLLESFGNVLATDLVARADLPSFASSAMDGFAVRAAEVANASMEKPTSLKIVGRAAIGHAPEVAVGSGEAVKIATGAPIPMGADAIVPVEDTHTEGNHVLISYPAAQGRHIRLPAEDVRSGELLVAAGRRISAPEIGLLASDGFARLPVIPPPRVVVISTGDELVEPGKDLAFGQLHDSNAYAVAAAVREVGAQPVMAGIVHDDPAALRDVVVQHSHAADAFISTGGVSVGERDPVKAAFEGRGEIDFYKVAMQPGMPQAFGQIEGKPYFGLPGNPVSTFVSFEVFVRPALLKMMGRRELFRPEVTAMAADELRGPVGKTAFVRVLISRGQDGFVCEPTGGRGSNLISTVTRANGLAILPPGVETIHAGGEVQVMVFRAMED